MFAKSSLEGHYLYSKPVILVLFMFIFLIGCAPVEAVQTEIQPGAQSVASDLKRERIQKINILETRMKAAEVGGVSIIGGDEAGLRKFIQRYFTHIYPGAPTSQTIIHISQLPESLPVEIPIPKGAIPIAVIQEPWESEQIHIILDVPQSQKAFGESYRQALGAAGWRPAPEFAHSGGFVASDESGEQYCLGENEGHILVWSRELPDGITDVRIHLQVPHDLYLCQDNQSEYVDPGMSQIPTLRAPAGVQMAGGGSGSSSDGSAYTSTDLVTELSAGELLAHYNAQLAQAGWQMAGQGSSEVVFWSTWTFIDEKENEWGGTLVVLGSYLNSDRRFALLNVERIP